MAVWLISKRNQFANENIDVLFSEKSPEGALHVGMINTVFSQNNL